MSRIIIRHSEPKDAQAIKEIYECVNAYSGTLQLPYPSGSVWESRIANIPENVYSFIAEMDGKIVGNLGFELCKNPRRRHAGSFGMGVRDEYQGKGIGSALLSALIELTDKWLNVRRIELTVYTDNHSAIALYKKFGFVVEGESQYYAFRNGQYISVYHMARIGSNT
ncbi:GNAT family N-acetyltransferase [Photobacterium sp.]|uniref:GNAT family N-acetyltransferase n=1 Tax=Photobacterium sp. TaxID=660 RepID=UPI00299EB1BF|nr:GNAT family N-acetyltransferase [Photobacterium sp.]MDX1302814.1 GNAT family N-acetyltransferase [Photobacterium sp.]